MSEPQSKLPRRIAIGVVALIALAVVAALVALKTPLLRVDLSEEGLGDTEAGKATAARMPAAHGGLDRWLDHAWVELTIDGEVPAASPRFGFDVGETLGLTLRFDPCDHSPMTGELRDGDRTLTYPAEASSGHHLLFASMRHLFEMPFAMRSADVVRGMAPADGHDRVFMSWGTAAPQMHTDQYIMHLGPDGQVVGFRSTVRLVAPFLTSAVTYDGRVERDGVWLPEKATVRAGAPDGDVAHAWRLTGMTLGPKRAPGTGCGG